VSEYAYEEKVLQKTHRPKIYDREAEYDVTVNLQYLESNSMQFFVKETPSLKSVISE
jgi:hypothetical protein